MRKLWQTPEDATQEAERAYRLQTDSQDTSGAYRPDSSQQGKGKKRLETEWHEKQLCGSSCDQSVDEGYSQNVADLIRIATFAHRKRHGPYSMVRMVSSSRNETIVAVQRFAWDHDVQGGGSEHRAIFP